MAHVTPCNPVARQALSLGPLRPRGGLRQFRLDRRFEMAAALCWSAAACRGSGRDGALANGGALCGPAEACCGCARDGALLNGGGALCGTSAAAAPAPACQ
jgi:hypothetical protein